MNKRMLLALGLAPVLSGCLGSAPKPAVNWTMEFERPAIASPGGEVLTSGPVRLAQVNVRAPYNGARLAVLRADGSVAFDNYNQFAAPPPQLVRNAVEDALECSGRFPGVINAGSSVSTPYVVEAAVTRLALDCRREGRRETVAEVELMLICDHKRVSVARAGRSVPVTGGNFTEAFSEALGAATTDAIRQLKND